MKNLLSDFLNKQIYIYIYKQYNVWRHTQVLKDWKNIKYKTSSESKL